MYQELKPQLKEYYKKTEFELPENSNWRYFKFRLTNNSWITVKARNKEKLKKYCLKYLPLEIYYSTSEFLNPLKAENPSYQVADRLFIRNRYLTFDVDNDDFKIACKDALKIIKTLKYKLKEVNFTGRKGIRLLFDVSQIKANLPKERELKTIRQRETILNKLKHINSIDKEITIDMNRIIRLPNSLHRETLYQCKKISAGDLENPESILNNAMKEREIIFPSQNNISKEERAGLISSFQSYKFIDAMVYGAKNLYVPFLIFHKTNFNRNKIKALQEVYNLSDFYIFETSKYRLALCCKTIDKQRYIKIARYCKANNLHTLLKYNHQWIRVSSVIDKDSNVIEEKPIFDYVIESNYGTDDTHSRPHISLLEKALGKTENKPWEKYDNLCGSDNKIKICVINRD